MRKKFVILGLISLLAGTAAFSWVFAQERKERQQAAFYKQNYDSELDEYLKQYNEWLQLPPEQRTLLPWGLDEYGKVKTKAQLRAEQQERLKADLDKLAASETNVYPFADILYGENWQEEVSRYKTRNKLRELILTASIVCMLAGGAILTWCLLLWTAWLLIKGLSRPLKSSAGVFRQRKEARAKQSARTQTKKDRKPKQEQKPNEQQSYLCQLQAGAKVLTKSGWQNFGTNVANQHEPAASRTAFSMRSKPRPDNRDSKNESEKERLAGTPFGNLQQDPHFATYGKMGTRQNGKPSQSVQQAAAENSEPLNNTLVELTQEMAAIREYASHQQDRVKKLQDGYDWNIIRNFCLRVIRCIDNLEVRINRLSEQDIETGDPSCNKSQSENPVAHLEEARDELLFALESSGVEQFEPEINSEYRGQEKIAEAVKDKEYSDDPGLTGKIAKVIRPGYQYFINEQNVKIVRTAQVKLFG